MEPLNCGTCSLCCHGKVFLFPDENATHLDVITDTRIDGKRLRRLITKADGECGHLEAGRCSVYEHRPRICRSFDCRDHYHLPAAERRRREAILVSPRDRQIIARGRELAESSK